MTDLERWREFLTIFGIIFEEHARDGAKNLQINYDGGEKNTGYIGFCTVVEFDVDEKFIKIGAWE